MSWGGQQQQAVQAIPRVKHFHEYDIMYWEARPCQAVHQGVFPSIINARKFTKLQVHKICAVVTYPVAIVVQETLGIQHKEATVPIALGLVAALVQKSLHDDTDGGAAACPAGVNGPLYLIVQRGFAGRCLKRAGSGIVEKIKINLMAS